MSFFKQKGIVDPRLVREYVRCPTRDLLDEVADFVASNTVGPIESFMSVMASLNKLGRFHHTIRLWERLISTTNDRRKSPTEVAYNIAMHAYFQTGKPDNAWDLYLELKRKAQQQEAEGKQNSKREEVSLTPGEWTYGTLISGLTKSNRFDKALLVVDEMKKQGVALNVAMSNMLISGFTKAGRYDEALQVAKDLKKTSGKLGRDTYIYMLRLWTARNDMQNLRETLKDMQAEGFPLDTQLYSVIITALAKAGHLTEAIEIHKEMRADKSIPLQMQPLNSILHAFAKKGEVEGARKYLEQMEADAGAVDMGLVGKGLQADKFTLNALLLASAATESIDKTFQTFRYLTEEKGILPDDVSYHTLISACCAAKDIDRAIATFNNMQREGIYPLPETCNTILKYFLNDRHLDQAIDMLSQLRVGHMQWSPNLNNFVALGECITDAEDFDKVYNVYTRWVEEAQREIARRRKVHQKTEPEATATTDQHNTATTTATTNDNNKTTAVIDHHSKIAILRICDTLATVALRLFLADTGLKIFESQQALGQQETGFTPSSLAFLSIFRVLTQASRYDEAFTLYTSFMPNSHLRNAPDARPFWTIYRPCARVLEPDLTQLSHPRELRQKAIAVLESILQREVVQRDSTLLNAVFQLLLTHKWKPTDDYKGAETILQRMAAAGQNEIATFTRALNSAFSKNSVGGSET